MKRLLATILMAMCSALTAHAQSTGIGSSVQKRNDGYRVELRAAKTAGVYVIGEASPKAMVGFELGSAFEGTLHACETTTYAAATCTDFGTALDADFEGAEFDTTRKYYLLTITTAESGSNVSYLNIYGSFDLGGGGDGVEEFAFADFPTDGSPPVIVGTNCADEACDAADDPGIRVTLYWDGDSYENVDQTGGVTGLVNPLEGALDGDGNEVQDVVIVDSALGSELDADGNPITAISTIQVNDQPIYYVEAYSPAPATAWGSLTSAQRLTAITDALTACDTAAEASDKHGTVMLPQGRTVLDMSSGSWTSPIISVPTNTGAGGENSSCDLIGWGSIKDYAPGGSIDPVGSSIYVFNPDNMTADATSRKVVLFAPGHGQILRNFNVIMSGTANTDVDGTTLLLAASADNDGVDADAFCDDGIKRAVFDKLHLSSAYVGYGTIFESCFFLDNTISNSGFAGGATGWLMTSQAATANNANMVSGNRFTANTVAIDIPGVLSCQDLYLFRNTIENNAYGIRLRSGSTCRVFSFGTHWEQVYTGGTQTGVNDVLIEDDDPQFFSFGDFWDSSFHATPATSAVDHIERTVANKAANPPDMVIGGSFRDNEEVAYTYAAGGRIIVNDDYRAGVLGLPRASDCSVSPYDANGQICVDSDDESLWVSGAEITGGDPLLVDGTPVTASGGADLLSGLGIAIIDEGGDPNGYSFNFDFSASYGFNGAAEQCVPALAGTGSGGWLCEGSSANATEWLMSFPSITDSGADTERFLLLSPSNLLPTAAGVSILDDADVAAMRTTLGAQAASSELDNLVNNCTVENDGTPIPDSCVGDGVDGGGGGGSIIYDIGDDGGNDSTAVAEIATSGDTNGIFSEPSADKILVNLANDWPKADLADGVAGTGGVDDTDLAAGSVDGGAGGEIADGTIDANDIASGGLTAADAAADLATQAELDALTLPNSGQTDNRLVKTSGTAGDLEGTGVSVDDSDNLSTPGTVTASGFTSTPHATDGGCLTVSEGTDDGANSASLCMPDSATLSGDVSVDAFNSEGKFSAAAYGTATVDATALNEASVEAGLEAVMDLQDMQGAVVDAQVPDTVTINGGPVTLVQSAAPAPTAEGRLEWETDDDHLIVGDGAAQVEFVPAEDVSGDATMTDAGVLEVAQADALEANGANCSAGSGALGVDTAGAAESCTDFAEAADTHTFTNKTLNVESTGNVVTTVEHVWFPAAGCNNATAAPFYDLPTSNGAAAACVTGTNTQKGVLDFDTTTSESAQVTHLLPSDWTGSVDVNIKWFAAATSSSVAWNVATICVADGETDDPAYNTASAAVDAAKGTTNQTNDAAITGLTVTGCAAGELLHLKVSRDVANGSDAMTGDARLIGFELVYRRAQ